jgi:hypothetical protein
MPFEKALSAWGSGAVNAFLLLLIATSTNQSGPGGGGGPPYEAQPAIYFVQVWRPFLQNASAQQWPDAPADLNQDCPEPQGTARSIDLDQAPLPDGYDPYGPRQEPFFACVRVDGRGWVDRARLLGTSGRPELDRRILRTILLRWRLASPPPDEARRAWQRVRLDAAPVDQVTLGLLDSFAL